MKVAIHQLHYFPWLGYLAKMATVDKFILLDDVQLTDNSNMFRNRLLTINGTIKYISVPFERNGYLQKKFRDLVINNAIDWQKAHSNFIRENYKKTPHFEEVWEKIKFIFEKKYYLLSEVTYDSLTILKEIFNISTETVFQSDLNYQQNGRKNQLIIDLCCSVGADHYLSGKGASKYMESNKFFENGITVEYQNFIPKEYPQVAKNHQFVAGLSTLDMLFNIGIYQSREILNHHKNNS
jgi:hypothetical protein